MKHVGTQEIKTEHLTLRRFKAGDEYAMFKNYMGQPEVTKYLRFPHHEKLEQSAEKLQETIDSYERQNAYTWAVVPDDVGEVIGMVALMGKAPELDECYELAYMIGREFWGKGYTTEAARAVLEYGFNNVEVNRIEANHATVNPASGRVMRKIGLKIEGRMQQKGWVNAGFIDSLWYGLTRAEYRGEHVVEFKELICRAKEVAKRVILSNTAKAGSVGAAVLTDKNNIYTGVCMDIACGIGFCAEHAAVAAMVSAGESRIVKVVAIRHSGEIVPPCGRCRELINQVNIKNREAEIMVGENVVVTLCELNPYDWTEEKNSHKYEELCSQRLKLVPINESYVGDIFENFTLEITRYMLPAPAKNIDESREFVTSAMEKSAQGIEHVYAITDGKTGEFLGCAGLHKIDTTTPELGIWTKKGAHGHGYGFEAISRLIAYAREKLSFEYLVYPVDEANYPSRRIPIMHGGIEAKKYDVVSQSGSMISIVEYHIL